MNAYSFTRPRRMHNLCFEMIFALDLSNSSNSILLCTELEKSRDVAMSLEEKMRQAEKDRRELEEARQKALEAKQAAELAASLEKGERERMVRGTCFIEWQVKWSG